MLKKLLTASVVLLSITAIASPGRIRIRAIQDNKSVGPVIRNRAIQDNKSVGPVIRNRAIQESKLVAVKKNQKTANPQVLDLNSK